jgi:hypothetical protein
MRALPAMLQGISTTNPKQWSRLTLSKPRILRDYLLSSRAKRGICSRLDRQRADSPGAA